MTLLPSASATSSPVPAGAVPPVALGIAMATLEAMAGRRPLHQIRSRMSRRAFEALVALHSSGRFRSPGFGRLTAQQPSPSAVEATASIHVGGRWLACVVRLDKGTTGWNCSHFAVLGLSG